MGVLTCKEYEKQFGFDKKKAERHLTKMVEESLVVRKGSGPGTYYELIAT
jgi:Fic family protein